MSWALGLLCFGFSFGVSRETILELGADVSRETCRTDCSESPRRYTVLRRIYLRGLRFGVSKDLPCGDQPQYEESEQDVYRKDQCFPKPRRVKSVLIPRLRSPSTSAMSLVPKVAVKVTTTRISILKGKSLTVAWLANPETITAKPARARRNTFKG